ncbi:hypothetical protein [Gordonia sp. CPCC 205333]|uniref:hypothetical protein n=1 Tax=Gordonia sp. CPCC 205333 TaxID=3140790 RepID=UPI003AF40562
MAEVCALNVGEGHLPSTAVTRQSSVIDDTDPASFCVVDGSEAPAPRSLRQIADFSRHQPDGRQPDG